ncbi:DUF3800 domain-containing protein [Citromicrobium bathyomarinum]|uniref:DUF3800 domain-containing protein n=1 Tax=Citromicrobium bathyomarinum TaxID=72174 RepID=UPI00315AF711
MVAINQVFVDESGTHDGSPCISIGGIIFKKNKAREFSKRWNIQLRRRGLKYFRMSECTHQRGQFQGKSKKECLEAELSLLYNIYKYAEAGFAVSLAEEDFDLVYEGSRDGIEWKILSGEAYSKLINHALVFCGSWADAFNFNGKLEYFFEAGHRHQGDAKQRIRSIVRPDTDLYGVDMSAVAEEMGRMIGVHKSAHRRYRYRSHDFAEKCEFPPLQAADMIAWLWRNTAIKQMNGQVPRKDWQELGTNLTLRYRHFSIQELDDQKLSVDSFMRSIGV